MVWLWTGISQPFPRVWSRRWLGIARGHSLHNKGNNALVLMVGKFSELGTAELIFNTGNGCFVIPGQAPQFWEKMLLVGGAGIFQLLDLVVMRSIRSPLPMFMEENFRQL